MGSTSSASSRRVSQDPHHMGDGFPALGRPSGGRASCDPDWFTGLPATFRCIYVRFARGCGAAWLGCLQQGRTPVPATGPRRSRNAGSAVCRPGSEYRSQGILPVHPPNCTRRPPGHDNAECGSFVLFFIIVPRSCSYGSDGLLERLDPRCICSPRRSSRHHGLKMEGSGPYLGSRSAL